MSANRFNRHIGNKKGQALRWRAAKPLAGLPDVMTRQRKRAAHRKAALAFMYQQHGVSIRQDSIGYHGGEPRRIMRAMAFTLAKRK